MLKSEFLGTLKLCLHAVTIVAQHNLRIVFMANSGKPIKAEMPGRCSCVLLASPKLNLGEYLRCPYNLA